MKGRVDVSRCTGRYHRGWIAVLVGAIGLLGGAELAIARLTGDPSSYAFPVPDLAPSEKATVVGLHFTSSGTVTLESAEVVYGIAHGHVGDPELLQVDLLDLSGNVVDQFNAWNPLWVFETDEYGTEKKITRAEATGLFTFPFRPDVVTMRVTNVETGQELAGVNVIAPAHEFCRENPGDPDCANVVNRLPVCDADGPYVAECAGATTMVSLDGSRSMDPDDDPLTYSWTGPFSGGTASGVSPSVVFSGLGNFAVDLTVADDWGGAAACSTTVTIQDTTAPEAACNAPATIVPPDAPVSFTATANDICGSASVAITGYDCYTYTKKGKRIDKTDSCVVAVSGDSISILDSGGVGDNITWTIEATDSSGNQTVENCALTVIRPE
jgi:hypothetical protein